MKIDLDDRYITYILDGLKSLAMHWIEFDRMTLRDLTRVCMMHDELEAFVNKRIADMDKEPAGPETLTRNPDPGERTVLGKEKYQKS